MFDTVLIANRGEIAVRVIQACRELGIESVAVFSEADRAAPHVRLADRSISIGPAAAAESYLDIGRLLDAASETGAGAVHPGYGFLAENAAFARAVEDAGLIWIGPPPAAIEAMGDKTAARERMHAAGVPLIPGSEALDDLSTAEDAAADIGYPVILKAAAGGGGKGMRVVEEPEALTSAFQQAVREAQAAFGDGRVYLERCLKRPRHIEIQVLADAEDCWHLGERECSIQRRHQKLIEEAPSPVLDAETREAMGRVAVTAARAVDYRGAGTVEFLYEDGEFYFLEMNTRIQVEHPVTELVTGVDLVRAQLRIARGKKVDEARWDGRLRGHAIECRISAEDPFSGFLPATGSIEALRVPAGPGVRWDGGIEPGSDVGLWYDPLLAKLIVHAPSRTEAITRMARALEELRVEGVSTTAPFHRRVMDDGDFRAGNLSIRYLEEHPELQREEEPAESLRQALLFAAVWLEEGARHPRSPQIARGSNAGQLSAWQQAVRNQ